MWRRQAATGLLSPRTARRTQTHPASQPASPPQDKCIYICNQKHGRLSGHGQHCFWTSAAWLFWYFNKYQAQTRLGASSLRNVSEGSAITHNKWAYANTRVFAMHKSLFGVHHGDAVCWYAIILKSIKVQVWVYHLVVAAGGCSEQLQITTGIFHE